jgi:hypothetical protein
VSVVLAAWRDEAAEDTAYAIAPDGCRDLILKRAPGRAPVWFLSALDRTASANFAAAGTRYLGWRLRPGARIDAAALLASLGRSEAAERAEELIGYHARIDPALGEALAALAEAPGIADAARGAR